MKLLLAEDEKELSNALVAVLKHQNYLVDAGINAAGGNDSSSMAGPGRGNGMMENDSNAYIKITGGEINVNASGDGIDSNGSLYISGGTTYVSGPTNSGNGALDYNGSAEISGGTLIAAGGFGGFGGGKGNGGGRKDMNEKFNAGQMPSMPDNMQNIQ